MLVLEVVVCVLCVQCRCWIAFVMFDVSSSALGLMACSVWWCLDGCVGMLCCMCDWVVMHVCGLEECLSIILFACG